MLSDLDWKFQILEGRPAQVLLAAARCHEADEIVVGLSSDGRAPSGHDSVSRDLIRAADRPVVVVPAAASGQGHPDPCGRSRSRSSANHGGRLPPQSWHWAATRCFAAASRSRPPTRRARRGGRPQLLGEASSSRRLVVTHGNGPQVGLLALMGDAWDETEPYPLDVLDAETEGQIGYVLEMQLDNFVDHQDTVALITRIVVDENDPAFGSPTKFIGPVYGEEAGAARWRRSAAGPCKAGRRRLAACRSLAGAAAHRAARRDQQPRRRRLSGGVRGRRRRAGASRTPTGHRGVEAVIDKDLASALLAIELGADMLVLATDVEAVYDDYGTPRAEARSRAPPPPGCARGELRRRLDGPEGRGRLPLRRAHRRLGAEPRSASLAGRHAGTQVQVDGQVDARRHASAASGR